MKKTTWRLHSNKKRRVQKGDSEASKKVGITLNIPSRGYTEWNRFIYIFFFQKPLLSSSADTLYSGSTASLGDNDPDDPAIDDEEVDNVNDNSHSPRGDEDALGDRWSKEKLDKVFTNVFNM